MTRVLVVEDEFLIALALQDMLEELGYQALGLAPTVDKALTLLSQSTPDIALLNVNLGAERSTAVAEVLLEMGVPFGLTTGYSAAQLPEAIFRDAPSAQKPVSLRALQNLLIEIG